MTRVEDKKKKRRLKKWVIGVTVVLVIVGGVAFTTWLNMSPTGGLRSGIIERIRRDLLSEQKAQGDPVNILLLGSDSRHGETARSDTLILVRLDYKEERIYFISIPRDMRVYIPNRGQDKINAAYAYGQARLTIPTVEGFLGIDLNHYVEVDFQGFKKLVDALGGLDITIKEPINDHSSQFGMQIPKGRQRMNGATALNYVRYRHGDSDFGRANRQQKFLTALVSNTLRFESILKLPSLIGIIDSNVGTDMSRREMISIGRFMREVKDKRIETYTLPGVSTLINGISYVEPDREAIIKIMEQMEAGNSLQTMKLSIESDKISMKKVLSVSLLNGSGKAGLATAAKARLLKWGLSVDKVRNADSFNYRKTKIRYAGGHQVEAYKIRRIFFGGALVEQAEKKMTDDIEITIGDDYYRYSKDNYLKAEQGL